MATVVLSTVGGIVGGPVGAAIGAAVGFAVDSSLLAPRAPSGPRLGDRAVQTSAYGNAIPKVFGRLRVAGTVIWATDIREDRHKAGGGKGGGKATTYSYSVSFAVALSGRAIRDVGRIWADGKLLRGAAGDWKSELGGFRLHLGDGADGPDPLIASIEGVGATPAYDDLAYAVFDTLQLADFGNRIPSLSFEVEADAGRVPVGTIAAALSEGDVRGDTAAALDGYAASGTSVRGALATLVDLCALSVRDAGDHLTLGDADVSATVVEPSGLGVGDPDHAGLRTGRAAMRSVAGEVQLSYYDPSLDWQAGLQRARGDRRDAPIEAVELAAGLGADAAKGLAEARLAVLDAGRDTATARLGWRRMDLKPGDTLLLPGRTERWRVAASTLDATAIELTLRALPAASVGGGTTASPGRPLLSPDLPAGPTTIHLLDLPALGDEALVRPRLLVAAAGEGAGWRGADLLASLDDGASWQPLGPSAPAAVIGTAITVLGGGSAELFDTSATVEVALLGDDMWLASADDDALVAGGNLVVIGDELVQFGVAEPLGERRFRLSRLFRGRRGREAAIGGHVAGERFVLLDAGSLVAWDVPLAALGTRVRLAASGRGDAAPVEATVVLTGCSVRPPAPVRLAASRSGDGVVAIGWVRRSRIGWLWAGGGDVPLGEESERYRVDIMLGARVVRSVIVTTPGFTYDAAARAADATTGGFIVAVSQLGTLAASDAVTLSVPSA